MSREKIYDNHGREINYLRLAVTDRCNLRCFYCMPEEGIKYVPREDLLTYEEMTRLISVLAGMGVNKVRITQEAIICILRQTARSLTSISSAWLTWE